MCLHLLPANDDERLLRLGWDGEQPLSQSAGESYRVAPGLDVGDPGAIVEDGDVAGVEVGPQRDRGSHARHDTGDAQLRAAGRGDERPQLAPQPPHALDRRMVRARLPWCRAGFVSTRPGPVVVQRQPQPTAAAAGPDYPVGDRLWWHRVVGLPDLVGEQGQIGFCQTRVEIERRDGRLPDQQFAERDVRTGRVGSAGLVHHRAHQRVLANLAFDIAAEAPQLLAGGSRSSVCQQRLIRVHIGVRKVDLPVPERLLSELEQLHHTAGWWSTLLPREQGEPVQRQLEVRRVRQAERLA